MRLDAQYVGETCEGNQKVMSLRQSTDIRQRTGNTHPEAETHDDVGMGMHDSGTTTRHDTERHAPDPQSDTNDLAEGDQPYP